MKNSNKFKIVIIGDSISQGLGSKHYNYCEELKDFIVKHSNVSIEIKNLAITGKTIFFANEISEQVKEENPDLILLFLGSVDGLIRPKEKGWIWKFLPKRYKLNGMLDPRPFYSHSFLKRICEHVDSWVRWHLKIILMKICGTYSWVELEEFETEYRKFLTSFADRKILMVSPVYVDERFFPNSNDNLKRYVECIKKLSKEYNQYYIDLISIQKNMKWEDIYNYDHFHPSKKGYTWYAKLFSDEIIKIINTNK